MALAFVTAFATVGALLAWKRPENPIGWLLSVSGLAYSLGIFTILLAHFHTTLTHACGTAHDFELWPPACHSGPGSVFRGRWRGSAPSNRFRGSHF